MSDINIKLLKLLTIALLTALALISVVQGCRNAMEYSQDFQWDAAKVLSLGMNPYDESLEPSTYLKSLGYEEYYKQMEANQFPSLLLILLPYTFLPPLMARYAWMVSNLVFTALVLLMLKKTFLSRINSYVFLVLSLLMLAGTPWRNQIGVGQHTLFSFLFFLLAVYLTEYTNEEHPLAAGLCLFVSYFKYTLTVPLGLYFIYKRKWKQLFISVVPHVLLTFVCAIYLKDSVINMILKPLKVASALSSEGSMDIGSMLGGGTFTMVLTVVLLLALLIRVCRVPSGEAPGGRNIYNDTLVISALLLWSLIITYHRSYDYFVMILPFSWLFENLEAKTTVEDRKKALYVLLAYSFVLLLVFFGLRALHESDFAIRGVAIVYYIFTAYMTVLLAMAGGKTKNK